MKKFFIKNEGIAWNLTDDKIRSDKILHSTQEYQKYWGKIKRGENFMFLRYGDGERMLMLGQEVHAQEGWQAPNKLTSLGLALQKTLNTATPPPKNYLNADSTVTYAVTCPCCNSELYFWYLQHLKPDTSITTANVWINANFPKFKRDFLELKRDAVLITNYRGKGKTFGKLNIKKHYTVDDDCVNFWEREGQALIKQIIDETGKEENLLYAFSAGPLSEPIMIELYKNNPNNCYIDFGSALNFIIHDGITRPFMLENHPLAKKTCWIFDNNRIDLNVDVLLTAYKRPQRLMQQLQAIQDQTLKPKRILLYQDAINSYYKVELNDNILKQFDNYKIAEENTGVWQRFVYAAEEAASKYVCVFDDDTIPGKRWLENCYIHMQQHRGVYGTNGMLMVNPALYPAGNSRLVAGWHTANKDITEVDFVGHSWFVERNYLDYMIKKPYINKFKYVGEDMCLSYSCQEKGIPTYVPPHPLNDLSLWGSLPYYGERYGADEVALSINHNSLKEMNEAIVSMRNDGWKFLVEKDAKYVQSQIPILNKLVKFQPNGQLEVDHSFVKFILSFFGKKQPIFMGEKQYEDTVNKFFDLSKHDYINLEDDKHVIRLEYLMNGLHKYALHILFTHFYPQLSLHLKKLGLVENVDFVDGRGLLLLNT